MGEKRGLRALQAWCKKVTEGYKNVSVTDMSSSWRDGLAFCALIHHFRPDLIDFDSLTKENILLNNRLAFSVAEQTLGIPALLDAEDMVKYSQPDKLSIATYVSQYYQFFEGRNRGATSNKLSLKRPFTERSTTVAYSTQPLPAKIPSKVSGGSFLRGDKCFVCSNRVFILERLMVDAKLYHRTCFTCVKCKTVLRPGAYATGDQNGTFECIECPLEEDEEGMVPEDTDAEKKELKMDDNAIVQEQLVKSELSGENKSEVSSSSVDIEESPSSIVDLKLSNSFILARKKFFDLENNSESSTTISSLSSASVSLLGSSNSLKNDSSSSIQIKPLTINEAVDNSTLESKLPPPPPPPQSKDYQNLDSTSENNKTIVSKSSSSFIDSQPLDSIVSKLSHPLKDFQSSDSTLEKETVESKLSSPSLKDSSQLSSTSFGNSNTLPLNCAPIKQPRKLKRLSVGPNSLTLSNSELETPATASSSSLSQSTITSTISMPVITSPNYKVSPLKKAESFDSKPKLAAKPILPFQSSWRNSSSSSANLDQNDYQSPYASSKWKKEDDDYVVLREKKSFVSTATIRVSSSPSLPAISPKSIFESFSTTPFSVDQNGSLKKVSTREESQIDSTVVETEKPVCLEGTVKVQKKEDISIVVDDKPNDDDSLNPFGSDDQLPSFDSALKLDNSSTELEDNNGPKPPSSCPPSPPSADKNVSTKLQTNNFETGELQPASSTVNLPTPSITISVTKEKVEECPPLVDSRSYPVDLNPFGDDDREVPVSKQTTTLYPDDLNPFGDDNEEEVDLNISMDASSVDLRSLNSSQSLSRIAHYDEHLNPFGDTEDDEEEDDSNISFSSGTTRQSLPTTPRQQRGSSKTLGGHKKRLAPLPPSLIKAKESHLSDPNLSRSSSGRFSLRNSPKLPKKAAPKPPGIIQHLPARASTPINDVGVGVDIDGKIKDLDNDSAYQTAEVEQLTEKAQKELDNIVKQREIVLVQDDQEDSTAAANNTFGYWKKKKRPAPSVPLPPRRQIKMMPVKEIQSELLEIEEKQNDLESQGRDLEMMIRDLNDDAEPSLDEEEFILQLFELVNQKNVLFRRQAELMYIKRSQSLEQEQADIEYQIRLIMTKPEKLKTELECKREEELLKRLLDVVELRNEIVESMDMDRQRVQDEDSSIQEQLAQRQGQLQEKMSPEKTSAAPPLETNVEDNEPVKKKKNKLKDKFKRDKSRDPKVKKGEQQGEEEDIDASSATNQNKGTLKKKKDEESIWKFATKKEKKKT